MCNLQVRCATCNVQLRVQLARGNVQQAWYCTYLQCALFKMQHAMCSIYWAPYNVVDMRREKCDINDKSSWNLYRHKGLILTWAGHAQHFVYTVGTWRLARQGNFKFGAHCRLAQKMPKHFFYISGSVEEFLPITGAIWGWGQFSSVAFFKWTVHRDFRPLVFFHHSNWSEPLTNGLKYFCFWLRFRRDIRIFSELRAVSNWAESTATSENFCTDL